VNRREEAVGMAMAVVTAAIADDAQEGTALIDKLADSPEQAQTAIVALAFSIRAAVTTLAGIVRMSPAEVWQSYAADVAGSLMEHPPPDYLSDEEER
jgi:hypothetical protein